MIARPSQSFAVAIVAQFIVGIGMHEHGERSMIESEPTYDVGKLRRLECALQPPSRMRSDHSLVKAAHLNLSSVSHSHSTAMAAEPPHKQGAALIGAKGINGR